MSFSCSCRFPVHVVFLFMSFSRNKTNVQELFKMFDIDRDGVLTFKEFERLTGVLGRTGYSLFYVSIQQKSSEWCAGIV